MIKQLYVLQHIIRFMQEKDVTPLLTHWGYIYLALTHWYAIPDQYYITLPTSVPFYWHGLILISAWMNNYMSSEV